MEAFREDLSPKVVFPIPREKVSAEFNDEFFEQQFREAISIICYPIANEMILEGREDADDLKLFCNTTLCISKVIKTCLLEIHNCPGSNLAQGEDNHKENISLFSHTLRLLNQLSASFFTYK